MGISERKEREKQQRRADILLAAEEVFFAKGFDRATMDDVAEAAELSKGTLYLYFKSKEDLHMGIAMKAVDLMNTLTAKVSDLNANGLEKLVKLGWAFIDFSKKFPDHMKSILLLEGMDLKKVTPSMGDLREVIFKGSPVALVLEFIEQGIEEELIRNDIPPRVIAHTLWMQMLGVIQVVAFKKNLFELIEITPESLYKNHIELVLNGIKR